MQHRVAGRQAIRKQRRCGLAFGAFPIGIASPGKIGGGEIAVVFPAFFVDQCLEPRPIGTGFGAKNTKAGLKRGILNACCS